MNEALLIDRWSAPENAERLAEVCREWEPCIEAFSATDNALIFESEATLYAVCLSESRLRHRHRVVEVHPGDVLVIPAGVGVEAEPGLDLLGFAHTGIPPYHFRERFIQSVCFEHLPFPTEAGLGEFPLIPRDDARHRIPFVGVAIDSERHETAVDPLSLRVKVVLGGSGSADQGEGAISVKQGDLIVTAPGKPLALAGSLRWVELDLVPELVHEARRTQAAASQGVAWSPEHFEKREN